MKQQDLLGIIMAMGITVIAVGVAFAGNTFSETPVSVNNSVSNPSTSEHGFGGITNTDGESIEFEFIPGNEINLDEHEFVRAKIIYTGYLQQMGRVTLNVFSVNTGETVKKSEIQLDLKNDNIWFTDVMHRFEKQNFIDNPDLLGTYLLRVTTEHGTFSGKMPFTVTMPSVKPIEVEQTATAMISTPLATTPDNVQKISPLNAISIKSEVSVTADGFDVSSLAPLFTEKINKAYLAKILKDYYKEKISKDDFVFLKSFDKLDCTVTLHEIPTGNKMSVSCNFISD